MIQSVHGEVTDRNETHQTVTIKRDGAYIKDWRVAGICRPGQTQAWAQSPGKWVFSTALISQA